MWLPEFQTHFVISDVMVQVRSFSIVIEQDGRATSFYSDSLCSFNQHHAFSNCDSCCSHIIFLCDSHLQVIGAMLYLASALSFILVSFLTVKRVSRRFQYVLGIGLSAAGYMSLWFVGVYYI